MKQLFFILIAFFTVAVPAVAQQLKTTRWDSYGVSFKAPSDLTVEDDSSEGYLAGNDTYYLTIQLLEGEGMKKEELNSQFHKRAVTIEGIVHGIKYKLLRIPLPSESLLEFSINAIDMPKTSSVTTVAAV